MEEEDKNVSDYIETVVRLDRILQKYTLFTVLEA